MSKIKITEEQLKRLIQLKNSQVNESVETTESKEKKEEPINESVEKIKSDFRRFVK